MPLSKRKRKPVRIVKARTRATRSRTRRKFKRRRTSSRRGGAVKGAQNQLKNFRQASMLAVAITGFLLTFLAPGEAGYSQDSNNQRTVVQDTVVSEEEAADNLSEAATSAEEPISRAAKDEAIGTLQRLWESFYANLPKILVAIGTLIIAWLLTRILRWLLRKVLGRWESAGAIITLVAISVWLFAIGLAISVVAGDIRALVGSLGLIGLALSWSLQVPIESFTGWLLNSFRGYYRVGDRISVGEVFGDVYRIDFLTTTVWEIGAPYRQGYVQAEQPTGKLVTFPNNEILSGTVVNFTSDFPYVWDELTVAVANESNIRLSMEVMEKVASRLLGDYMREPAQAYAHILQKADLHNAVSEKPQIFISANESWTDIVIRYLVNARERRKWKSELTLLITEELNKPDYKDKIIPVYPRQQLQMINPAGVPVDIKTLQNGQD